MNQIAQTTEYKLLTPLPHVETAPDSGVATANSYISGFFILIIMVAGGLAVLRIIFGGIQYMSTDAFSGKSEAKTIIEHAIWGLILAISAWLILYTVNPKLTTFNITLPTPSGTAPVGVGGTGGGIGGGGPSDLTLTQQQAINAFRQAGIDIVGGINLAGIRQGIIDEIAGLKIACGCDILVTSATGGVHEIGTCSHANGYKVDLRLNNTLTTYITRNYQRRPDRSDGAQIYQSPSGGVYALESNHWDIAKC